MKKHLLIFTSTLLLGAVAQGQVTAFTGTPNANITNAPSWDNGLPLIADGKVGTINIDGNFSGNIVGWEVNHTGGTLSTGNNRQLGAASASDPGTIWNLDGGNLDFGTAQISRGTAGSNYAYTVNMSSGTVTVGNVQNTASSFWNVSGGTVNASGTWSSGGTLTMTGGAVNINTLNMTPGGSTVTFGLGISSLSVTTLTQGGNTLINFLPGSGGSITITGFGLSDYETLWTQTRLRFDGGNVGSFADHFVVTGSTLAVIPEPSTYAALFGLAALALVVYRRRRTA